MIDIFARAYVSGCVNGSHCYDTHNVIYITAVMCWLVYVWLSLEKYENQFVSLIISVSYTNYCLTNNKFYLISTNKLKGTSGDSSLRVTYTPPRLDYLLLTNDRYICTCLCFWLCEWIALLRHTQNYLHNCSDVLVSICLTVSREIWKSVRQFNYFRIRAWESLIPPLRLDYLLLPNDRYIYMFLCSLMCVWSILIL